MLTGCALPKLMPYADRDPNPVKDDKAVYLLAVTLRNAYRTGFQPSPSALYIAPADKGSQEKSATFIVDGKSLPGKDDADRDVYLLRAELAPGRYVIRTIFASAGGFPFLPTFEVPVHANLQVGPPGIYYLGHLEAIVRERQNGEFRAGPMVPLLDQAIGGASGGTFDIRIWDQWSTDEARFRQRFEALRNAPITLQVLPPFDRATAQRWWETH